MAIWKILKKIKRRMTWFANELYWLLLLLKKNQKINLTNNEFSIGITTFKDRYHIFFKKLLKRMTYSFPGTEIIVAVNGHYDQKGQVLFLEKIKNDCAAFPHVKLVTFIEPQGLSKLWNQIILHAGNNKIFICNDDIKISPFFRKNLLASGILNEHVAVIKDSWSHFLVSRDIISQVGWFDERLLEIGGEDDDYLLRLALKNIYPASFNIEGIINYSHKLKANTYGKDMTGDHPYSTYNEEFLSSKWEMSRIFVEGAVLHRRGKYWRLKENMETPDFYSHINLKS